ncbi:PREDICTED: transmembrane emp24 domain-containing protein 7 [Nipponia nippon]|nr:PREDICTED: transmembrane emp24 domain-containing protein 7 [Nipponia nippon]
MSWGFAPIYNQQTKQKVGVCAGLSVGPCAVGSTSEAMAPWAAGVPERSPRTEGSPAAASQAHGLTLFQVITGGHYDVDCRLEDPDGTVLYKEMKKQYDSFTFTASRNGTYKFCFSNEFSTFTHKTVYFDFQVGEDPPLFPSENRVTALTQMESACVSIHEALKSVIDYQTHFRLREAQGRSRAEDLNTRVAYWSIGEAIILLVVSIGQVFLLKSFFSDKRTTTTRVGS